MHKVTRRRRLLLPSEVASLFRVDPKTVTRWAHENKLPWEKTPGGHHRFEPTDVRVLMGQHMAPEVLVVRVAELNQMLDANS
jgi:excisionase family DNA binding protein